MSILREKMIKDMKLRNLSESTQEAYLFQVKSFAEYYGRSPSYISEEELRDYLLYLSHEKRVSESKFRQTIYGIKFLYTITLNRTWQTIKIVRPPKSRKLPIILSQSEIKRLLEVTTNLKHVAILSMVYSGGLRVGEVCDLRIGDIDSDRMQIRITQSKGRKDRYTILGKAALVCLNEFWESNCLNQKERIISKHDTWLFPGGIPSKPISIRTVQKVFSQACEKAEIVKKVSIHSLRHSFATHLMEAGIGLRYIQTLLGHKNLATTAIYTHVCREDINRIVSPIDTL